jgi:hypothetical protein
LASFPNRFSHQNRLKNIQQVPKNKQIFLFLVSKGKKKKSKTKNGKKNGFCFLKISKKQFLQLILKQ